MTTITKLSLLLLLPFLAMTGCDLDDDETLLDDDDRSELVDDYADAYLANQPYPAVTSRLMRFDEAAAYDFQEDFVDELLRRGQTQSGWKLGFTGDAPRPFGAPSPVFGRLLTSQNKGQGSTIDISETFVDAALGVEIALFIGQDRTFETFDFPLSRETVLGLIESVAPLTEFPELGFQEGRMNIDFRDLIANNAGAKAYVVGDRIPLDDLAVDIDSIDVRVFRDDELIAESFSGDALGSQVEALEFLLLELAKRGEGVRAGQIIATGSLGGDLGLDPGEYRFEYENLGTSRFTLVE